jgi:putative ABC transport system permease protein
MDKPVEPEEYSPLAQRMQNPLTFAVRTIANPESAIAAARRAVHAVDKDVALTGVATLKEVVQGSMSDQRFRTVLLSAFAAVALLLAAVGIYGVLAYFVTQRGHELGVRLALGARPAALFRLVIGQGLRPVAVGAVAGVLGALAVTSVMQSLLFGVEAIDVPTYGVAVALLGLIATAACTLPALRAMRLDPLVALREE